MTPEHLVIFTLAWLTALGLIVPPLFVLIRQIKDEISTLAVKTTEVANKTAEQDTKLQEHETALNGQLDARIVAIAKRTIDANSIDTVATRGGSNSVSGSAVGDVLKPLA